MMLKTITEVITAGAANAKNWPINFSTFRLLSAPSGSVTVRFGRRHQAMEALENIDAGVGFRAKAGEESWDYLYIESSATQTIKFMLGDTEVTQDRILGDVYASGNLGTLAQKVAGGVNVLEVAERGAKYGAAFSSSAALVANTPENIVAAASNVNGLIVWAANFLTYVNTATTLRVSLLSKASAPASPVDGDVLAMIQSAYVDAVPAHRGFGALDRPIIVPSGKRLDFISSDGEAVGLRSCLYTIL